MRQVAGVFFAPFCFVVHIFRSGYPALFPTRFCSAMTLFKAECDALEALFSSLPQCVVSRGASIGGEERMVV
jgi:hypothetical protein